MRDTRYAVDSRYEPKNVPTELRPVFDQLQKELGRQFEIWVRIEDFGRRVTAGILNKSKSIAVTVPIAIGSRHIRTTLTAPDIDRIRSHLTSNATSDLAL
jgi:ABC-type phosphate/phosphonate transport system substrate-binding protein